ncbi:MAG: AmmeMemoRadiSam system protein B [Nitrososphaerota archaeon]
MPRRRPAVAGMFYEGVRDRLLDQIRSCFLSPHGPGTVPSQPPASGGRRVPALISPHAGYMYSGPVAAHGFAALSAYSRPEGIIVVGPNHYGVGTEVSLYPGGSWVTPLGEVGIDEDLNTSLLGASDIFYMDETSHSMEHSIEVQIPFLQFLLGEVKFSPVCILDQSLETCMAVGEALAKVVGGRNILIIASTDFTHYEPHRQVIEKDAKALEKIVQLDVEGMYEVNQKYGITMCGYGPVAAVLTAAKRLGCRGARVLKQSTSGETSGDYGRVVGYASCILELAE